MTEVKTEKALPTADTSEFWALADKWSKAPGCSWDQADIARQMAEYMQSRIQEAYEQGVEAGEADRVPLSADATSVFIDGFGLVPLAYPSSATTATPESEPLNALAEIEDLFEHSIVLLNHLEDVLDDENFKKIDFKLWNAVATWKVYFKHRQKELWADSESLMKDYRHVVRQRDILQRLVHSRPEHNAILPAFIAWSKNAEEVLQGLTED